MASYKNVIIIEINFYFIHKRLLLDFIIHEVITALRGYIWSHIGKLSILIQKGITEKNVSADDKSLLIEGYI